jgi:hypothetical protein
MQAISAVARNLQREVAFELGTSTNISGQRPETPSVLSRECSAFEALLGPDGIQKIIVCGRANALWIRLFCGAVLKIGFRDWAMSEQTR